jgi:metal-dependent amidase/aminoacylase/carboxypeptidase family protein
MGEAGVMAGHEKDAALTGLYDEAHALAPQIVALRRAIHAEPELGLHNPATRDKIRADLAGLPLEWREGPSTTGLVAVLRARRGMAPLFSCAAIPMPCR